MSGLSDELIETTRRFWEERTGEPVSEDDAREAVRNVGKLFDLLSRWDEAEQSESADAEADHLPSETQEPDEEPASGDG